MLRAGKEWWALIRSVGHGKGVLDADKECWTLIRSVGR
jgi:hypothetical protein